MSNINFKKIYDDFKKKLKVLVEEFENDRENYKKMILKEKGSARTKIIKYEVLVQYRLLQFEIDCVKLRLEYSD